jgi:hypothetical protein
MTARLNKSVHKPSNHIHLTSYNNDNQGGGDEIIIPSSH